MGAFVREKWKELKEARELAYLKLQKNNKLKPTNKYCSFLKNTLLPKKARYKFDYTLNNDKWNYIKFKIPLYEAYVPKWMTHNEEVSQIIYSTYFAIYFAYMEYEEGEELKLDLDDRANFLFLFDPSIIYFFLFNYLNEFFAFSNNLRFLIYSYILDLNYEDTYFDMYNYYIFQHIYFFFVFYNLGNIKLEHDKVLTHIDKWEKIPLMDLDFFYYSEFTNFNLGDDSLWNYQDNIFSLFCIYEFQLDFDSYYCNILNFCDFFHWPSILIWKRPEAFAKKTKRYLSKRKYLSNLFYRAALVKRRSKEEPLDEEFYEDYNESFLIYERAKIDSLDYYDNMMSFRNYMIKIPYLYFFLYTWYFTYHRSARYNLYVRSFKFFEEYTSKKVYFILHNNPYGKNRTKMFYFNYQRLWTIDHFKYYIEERFFNKWFLFYSSKYTYLKFFMNNDLIENSYCFNSLLTNNNLNVLLNINDFDKGYDSNEYKKVYEFFSDNLSDSVGEQIFTDGYKLMMRTRQSKFTKRFRLSGAIFLEFDELVEAMYTLPYDIFYYYETINKSSSFDLLLNIYDNKFNNYYFLKDFYNLDDDIELIKTNKIIGLYNRIVYLFFYIVDAYFLKYFWRKYFPRRLKRLWRAFCYLDRYLVQRKIKCLKRNNINEYDYFNHYLSWRMGTTMSVLQNGLYEDLINSCLSVSNMILKSRFLNLLYKVKLILNLNNIDNIYKIQRYILFMKDFYFQLFNGDWHFIMSFFLNNVFLLQGLLNMNLGTYSCYQLLHQYHIIDLNFLYRYYVAFFLFNFNYYDDWFDNQAKRVLWIFHPKDYNEHEGIQFYKETYSSMY